MLPKPCALIHPLSSQIQAFVEPFYPSKLQKTAQELVNRVSVGCSGKSLMHRWRALQLTEPKGYTAKILVPDTRDAYIL